MDLLAIGIIAVVVTGIAWVVFFSGSDSEPEAKAPARAVTSVGRKPEETGIPKDLSDRLTAKVKTMPGNAALNSRTKAALEELGRDMGVELDKRKTKANMIADLKAQVK